MSNGSGNIVTAVGRTPKNRRSHFAHFAINEKCVIS